MIKAILCDVGGVLVQRGDGSKRRDWEERLHLEPGQLEKLIYAIEPADRATIGLVNSRIIWQDIEEKFSLTDNERDQLTNDFYGGDKLNIPLYSYLERIKNRYKTAILSNAWENARDIYTQKYQLDSIFSVMIISAEIGMTKPQRKIFTYALDLLQVAAYEAVFVDDTEENVAAARMLGIHTVLFTDTKTAIEKINLLLS